MNKKQIIKEAKRVLKVELESLKTLSNTFGDNFYKIVSVGDIGSSYLQPSFGIGGYLILIGAGIQFYACFSSANDDDVIEKDIAARLKNNIKIKSYKEFINSNDVKILTNWIKSDKKDNFF